MFVEHYAVHQNAKRAAIEAGYGEGGAHETGRRLLLRQDINNALCQEYASRIERTQIDQDYVVTRAVELVERCMQAVPVYGKNGKQMMELVNNGNGDEPVGIWQFNPRDAATALKILATHLGMDHTTVNHNVSGTVTHVHKLSPVLSEMLDRAYKDITPCQEIQASQFALPASAVSVDG